MTYLENAWLSKRFYDDQYLERIRLMPMLHVVHMLLLLLTLTLPIDQALTDLGDNDWRVRERAYFVLNARMNTNLYGRIHELRDKTTDLEVSVRLNQLIHAHQLKTNPYLFFRRLFP